MGFLREAGAGAASVDELAVAVVAERESADAVDSGVALCGEGEAADDELLLANAFGFEPVAGAAGDVGCRGALGDDAFGVELAGALEDGGAVGFDVFAEADVVVGVGEEGGEEWLCAR